MPFLQVSDDTMVNLEKISAVTRRPDGSGRVIAEGFSYDTTVPFRTVLEMCVSMDHLNPILAELKKLGRASYTPVP